MLTTHSMALADEARFELRVSIASNSISGGV